GHKRAGVPQGRRPAHLVLVRATGRAIPGEPPNPGSDRRASTHHVDGALVLVVVLRTGPVRLLLARPVPFPQTDDAGGRELAGSMPNPLRRRLAAILLAIDRLEPTRTGADDQADDDGEDHEDDEE